MSSKLQTKPKGKRQPLPFSLPGGEDPRPPAPFKEKRKTENGRSNEKNRELLPAGTLVDLWLNQTKPSRKAYPSKFRHLVYADGTTGLHVLSGIPAGTRVAVKGRVVRPDGGRSGYAQAEIITS